MVALTHNLLEAAATCPSCGKSIQTRIDFQYGGAVEKEYHLGEPVEWGGDSIGEPGRRNVVLNGIGLDCPLCGFEELGNFEIHVEDDTFVSVKPLTKVYDFSATDEPFIVVED